MNEFQEYLDLMYNDLSPDSESNELRRRFSMLHSAIKNSDDTGGIPLELSSHAYHRAATRIQQMSIRNIAVYNDVVIIGKNQLYTPVNLSIFILENINEARINNSFTVTGNEESKNFKYESEISPWSGDGGKVTMVSVVQNNVVKTVFFNME